MSSSTVRLNMSVRRSGTFVNPLVEYGSRKNPYDVAPGFRAQRHTDVVRTLPIGSGPDGHVSPERDAVHDPPVVAVVAVRVVQGVAVVPQHQVAGTPAMADDVLGLGDVRVEHVEDGAALELGDALDVRGETGIDEQGLAAGLRGDTDDGVAHRHQFGDLPAVPGVPPVSYTHLTLPTILRV